MVEIESYISEETRSLKSYRGMGMPPVRSCHQQANVADATARSNLIVGWASRPSVSSTLRVDENFHPRILIQVGPPLRWIVSDILQPILKLFSVPYNPIVILLLPNLSNTACLTTELVRGKRLPRMDNLL